MSFDQQVTRRLTLFARYGFQNSKVNEIAQFWSCGGQIAEPFRGRKSDRFAIALASSIVSQDYRLYNGRDITASVETIWEAYYSYDFRGFLTLSPDLQVVFNPDADKTLATEVVAGIRVLLAF